MWSRQDSRLTKLYALLESGREAQALAVLEQLAPNAEQYLPDLNLRLASLCTLFEDKGVKLAKTYLKQVRSGTDAFRQPLFITLNAELMASQGDLDKPLKKALERALNSANSLTRYHGARAQFFCKDARGAQQTLQALNPAKLPVHLQWRYWNFMGELLICRKQMMRAVKAYQKSLDIAPEPQKPLQTFSIAEVWLHVSRPDEALDILGDEVPPVLELAETVRGFYLLGVTHRQLGHLTDALAHFQRAQALAQEAGESPFELLQESARLHVALGNMDKALDTYQDALESVPARNRVHLQHEYARALKDFGRFDTAELALRDVLAEARYPRRAEASAELAEVSYFLGKFNRVKPLAEYAIKGGVVGSACLSMGRVALEYFHLDEAESWLEQAASASEKGDSLWLSAQLLLAETFAHKADEFPERLKDYAERALAYLPEQDPWISTLEGYIDRANEILAGQPRMVN